MTGQDKLAALDMLGSMTKHSDNRLLPEEVIRKFYVEVLFKPSHGLDFIAFARAVEQAVLANSVVKDSVTTEATCTDNAENYTCSENVSKKVEKVYTLVKTAEHDQAIRDQAIWDSINCYSIDDSARDWQDKMLSLIGTPVLQGDKP
jgi:hypothetical protein